MTDKQYSNLFGNNAVLVDITFFFFCFSVFYYTICTFKQLKDFLHDILYYYLSCPIRAQPACHPHAFVTVLMLLSPCIYLHSCIIKQRWMLCVHFHLLQRHEVDHNRSHRPTVVESFSVIAERKAQACRNTTTWV